MVIILLAGWQSPLISKLDDSHIGHVLALAPPSAYFMNGKNQPHSQLVPVCNVLRIHALQCHERKLHLHDGTVRVELGRLVEIPPSGEPPDDRIEKYSVSI